MKFDPQQLQQQMMQAMQQAQQMQEELESAVAEPGTAGGGMVTVTISGDLVVKDIAIDPDAIDPEDPELLQDTVLAAVNEAIRQAQELAAKKMGGLTGGLDLGGLGLPPGLGL